MPENFNPSFDELFENGFFVEKRVKFIELANGKSLVCVPAEISKTGSAEWFLDPSSGSGIRENPIVVKDLESMQEIIKSNGGAKVSA